MEKSSSDPSNFRDELRDDTERVASAATQRIEAEADSRKGEAAGQAKQVSSALRSAADDLDPNSPSWLRSALEQGARAIDQVAHSIEQKDSRQLLGEIQRFARERPGPFLAGCAAAGFATARILKAGGTAVGDSTAYSRTSAAYEPYSSEAMRDTTPAMKFAESENTASTGTPTMAERPS